MHSINGTHSDGLNAIPWPAHAEIARYAAQLWEKRGRPSNCDEQIWLEAEQMLLIANGYTQPRATRSAKAKPVARNTPQSQLRDESSATSSHTHSNPSRANV